jgi:hypothetical protein
VGEFDIAMHESNHTHNPGIALQQPELPTDLLPDPSQLCPQVIIYDDDVSLEAK